MGLSLLLGLTSVRVPMAGWRRGMSTFWLMRDIILMRSCSFLREVGGRRRVQSCRASMATHSDWGCRRPAHANTHTQWWWRQVYLRVHQCWNKTVDSLLVATFIHHCYITFTELHKWMKWWIDDKINQLQLQHKMSQVKWIFLFQYTILVHIPDVWLQNVHDWYLLYPQPKPDMGRVLKIHTYYSLTMFHSVPTSFGVLVVYRSGFGGPGSLPLFTTL